MGAEIEQDMNVRKINAGTIFFVKSFFVMTFNMKECFMTVRQSTTLLFTYKFHDSYVYH